MKQITFQNVVYYLLLLMLVNINSMAQVGYIENKGQIINEFGQTNYDVKFLWSTNGLNILLKENGFSYEVIHNKTQDSNSVLMHTHDFQTKKYDLNNSKISYERIDVDLIGKKKSTVVKLEDQSQDFLNYFTCGSFLEGITHIHHYGKIVYQNIYENIDLEFTFGDKSKSTFKYNFIIRPGGKVSDIRLKYSGTSQISTSYGNNLIISTSDSKIKETITESYELENHKNIQASYRKITNNIYGYEVSEYNHNNTIVIDPWSSYYGGSGNEEISGLFFDSFNNIVACGTTSSLTNIATSGAYQNSLSGMNDAFIIKFDINGVRQWATYFGGSKSDYARGLTIDAYDNIVVTGSTSSSGNIATLGAYQNMIGGMEDAFIAKFDATGSRMWSTYVGGSGSDYAFAIAKDFQNNLILTGHTNSLNGISTSGAHQVSFGGGDNDAFIMKFSASGNKLWGTYYGGDNPQQIDKFDEAYGVGCDNNGNIFVTGFTSSKNNIATMGSHQDTIAGYYNCFLAKFDTLGNRQWGTYYGGEGEDGANALTIDLFGNVIITGYTNSISNIATPNAFQTVFSGNTDCLVAKFSTIGFLIWGTYYGGNGTSGDWGKSVTVDWKNNILLTGVTNSSNGIATTASYQEVLNGKNDVFIVKFDSLCNRKWGTYYGGNDNETGYSITTNISGNVVIGGSTSSLQDIATTGTYQTTYGGGISDCFLASFDSTGHITAIPFLNNANKNNLLQVYPNPTKDKIMVRVQIYTGKEGSLKLQTIEGKLLKQCSVKAEETSIDLKELAIGVYLLEYSDGEVCETVKVVKE